MILKRLGGCDGTKAFRDAGHSPNARVMMKKYAVAVLGETDEVLRQTAQLDVIDRPKFWRDEALGNVENPYIYGFKQYSKRLGERWTCEAHRAFVLEVVALFALCNWPHGDAHVHRRLCVLGAYGTVVSVVKHGTTALKGAVLYPASLACGLGGAAYTFLAVACVLNSGFGAYAAAHGLSALLASRSSPRITGLLLAVVSLSHSKDGLSRVVPFAFAIACLSRSGTQLPALPMGAVPVAMEIAFVTFTVATKGPPTSFCGLFGPTADRCLPSSGLEVAWALLALGFMSGVASWRQLVEASSLSGASHHKVLQGCALGVLAALFTREITGYYGLLALALIVAHGSALYDQFVPGMRERGCRSDQEVDERGWQWSVASNVDFYRHTLVASPLFLLGRFLVFLANCVVPKPMEYFVYPEATPSFPNAQVGMARFVPPSEPCERPNVFVCNVGHMLRGPDAVVVGQATHSMSSSLGDARGFAGQFLADIPVYEPTLEEDKPHWTSLFTGFLAPAQYRQLNLSGWTDGGAAHDWYVNNDEHKKVVRAHTEGLLSSFSSMLATLSSKKPPRYDVRCLLCAKINHNYPETKYCTTCGARSPDLPLF
jgi:hypothetical protein